MGISHPAKSTIRAPSVTWNSWNGVCLSMGTATVASRGAGRQGKARPTSNRPDYNGQFGFCLQRLLAWVTERDEPRFVGGCEASVAMLPAQTNPSERPLPARTNQRA